MNEVCESGKPYTIHAISTTLVTEKHLDKYCHLKLATSGKAAWLIGRYTIHSHQFGFGIPMGNTKLNELTSNGSNDEQSRLPNLKIIFIYEYSRLR